MTNEKRIDPLLNMETVGGGGSTAPTTRLYAFKPYIGQKLGQELVDSGIPLDVQHQLNYSNVNREECFQLMGYKWTGWVVLYKDLNGNPLLHNGQPFYRFKPDAGQLKGKKPAKYLSMKDSGYFSLKEESSMRKSA